MAHETSWSTKEILGTIIGSGVALVTTVKLIRYISAEKPKEYPKDVVILFQIPRTPAAPNLSPFALKLETFLRMAKIPYQNEYCMQLSSKKKTPWIMYNGKEYCDSQFIIEFLNKEFEIDLSKHLKAHDKAVAHSMRKMTEESLYWTLALSRWVYSYNDPSAKKVLPVSQCVFWQMKNAVKKAGYYQGYGRHTEEEVERICRQDLQALSDHIGNNMFLMGNQPCEEDAAVFGMLAMMWLMPETSFFTKILKDKTYPNLIKYVEKIKKEFWGDDYEEKKADKAEKDL